MPFTILSKEDFQNHLDQATEKSFMQSVEMAELLSKRGFAVEFVGWQQGGETRISALLYNKPMTGGLMMEINSGPVVTDSSYLSDFYRALKDHAKKKGALELRVKPYQNYQLFDKHGKPIKEADTNLIQHLDSLGYYHHGLKTGYPNGEPQWHYLKDLSEVTSENLIKSFNTNAKRLLKKARTFPIIIRSLQKEELGIFKDIQDHTSLRQGYSSKELSYYEKLYDSFGKQAQFLTAFLDITSHKLQLEQELQTKDGDEAKQIRRMLDEFSELEVKYNNGALPLASILMIYQPQEATYLFGGFYSNWQQFNAPILLQEQAMLTTIDRNITTYNFLGISGVFDGSDGVLRFKQNFNGYIGRKAGDFSYFPRPWKYKFLQILKRLLGRH